MQIDIRPTPADMMSGFIASSNLMSIDLKWNLPNPSGWYRGAQVWVNTINDRESATLAATVSGTLYSYAVTDINTRYFWIRAINEFDRPDGAWTGPASSMARRVGAGDLDAEAFIKRLSLQASSQVIAITKAGATTPSSITLTASMTGLTGSPTWTVIAGTVTLGGSANAVTRTISPANMLTDSVTIQVDQDGLSDVVSIVKIREGLDGSQGAAAITGFLTNEAAGLAADSVGNVFSYGTAGGQFKVFEGITEMTANAAVTYSIASTSNASGSINSSGIYTVTGMTADQATITFRAVYKGLNIDKILALSKSKTGQTGATGSPGSPGSPGSNGSDGQRGTMDVVLSGSWPSDSSASSAFSSATGYWPINRDRLTYTNGTNSALTKFYSNGSWLTIAAWINGNMVVDGTFSASKINGGTLTGVTMNIGSGQFIVNSSGLVSSYDFFGYNSQFGNLANPGLPALRSEAIGLSTASGIVGKTASSNIASHAIHGTNTNKNTSGILGCANGYDIYADGTSSLNYGPFTGSHDALILNGADIQVGDLVVDVECVASRGYSNTLFTVERSSMPNQRGVHGVVAFIAGPLGESYPPAAMVDGRSTILEESGGTTTIDLMSGSYYAMADTHTLVAMNAVGEGSIRVCGEGGPIGPDDLLVTSSIPGVAMKQADDIIRGYSIAKARVGKDQVVTFSSSDEVKLLSCIYICG